jgi:sporulation protein YqfC
MQKKSMGQFISDVFDIPLEGISNVPSAQLVGNVMLDVDGCIGIKKYEEDEIIIRCKEYLIKITGMSLSMLTFSQGRISVRGVIKTYEIEKT